MKNTILNRFLSRIIPQNVEQHLKESELHLQQLQQIIGLATYSFDLTTNAWEGSNGIAGIFGFENFSNKTIDDWAKCIHPDMRDEILEYFNLVLLKSTQDFNKELKIIHKSSTKIRWVNFIGNVIYDKNDRPIKMLGSVWDISERKEEQALTTRNLIFTETLLNSVPSPVFFMDAEARYIGCNQAFTEQMGVTDDDIRGKTVYEIWPSEENLKNYRSDLEQITNRGKTSIRSSLIDKAGNRRDLMLVKNVFSDENGLTRGLVGTYLDITDILHTEEALRKSEQMLQTVLDHFPGVVFWKDVNSTYMGCNKAFANGAGLSTPADIIGKTDFDLPWSNTEATHYRKDDIEVMEQDLPKVHIIEQQHQADGKVIWFDTNKVPFKDENGNIIGVIGVSSDISDKKIIEEQRNFLLACIENTDDMIIVKNLDSKIVSANKAWIQNNGGLDLSQIINKTENEAISNFSSLINKEAQLKAQQLKHGEFLIEEKDIITESGQNLTYRIKRYPIYNEENNLIGTGTIQSDITESKNAENALRASEQRYMLLANNISDGIFVCKDGMIEFTNKSFLQILGYKETETIGKLFIDLIVNERKTDFAYFLSFDSDTNQQKSIETECLKSDGESIFVELFVNYVSNEKLIYGILHDITEKRQIQQQNMLKAIIQTEEQERANFSKELHDGLGPLLSTIKIYLQWSMRPNSNKSHKEIIEKAEEVLEEALITVKEISNRLSPHLLINYGLTSAIQSFVNKLEETNTVKIKLESNLNRRIDAEIEVALYRAVIECVNNTMKHAKAKHISIILSDNKNQIQLCYQDDGEGFDITNKLDEKKGLGLYNLQNRIKTIGGDIMMFSKPHEGVNYNIIVPVKNPLKPKQ
jgi:PAS domain S-box-containing protein